MATGQVAGYGVATWGPAATSRIVEIALTTVSGTVLFETLLSPGGAPLLTETTAIQGITGAVVEGALTSSEVLPRLTEALAGRRIVIYNRDYDTGRLRVLTEYAEPLAPGKENEATRSAYAR